MKKILVLAVLALFGLQDNDLSAKTKGDTEMEAAQATINAQGTGSTIVTIKTSEGTIEVMLYDETPLHRDNFLRHIQSNTYNGVLFHRVIWNFMIQAGDPTSKNNMATAAYGLNDAGDPVPAEIRPQFFHHSGALAAARRPDAVNPERESSGSQFFIAVSEPLPDSIQTKYTEQTGVTVSPERAQVYRAVGGVPYLDGSYTIFGRVTKGMKTVEWINRMPTDSNDRPREDVYIRSVKIERK